MPNLWAAVKAVSAEPEAEGSGSGSPAVSAKRPYADFGAPGADLDAAGKKKLEEIDVALTKATTKFSENVLDATNAFELLISDEEKLAGLPESARLAARESAKSKGQGRLAPYTSGAKLYRRP